MSSRYDRYRKKTRDDGRLHIRIDRDIGEMVHNLQAAGINVSQYVRDAMIVYHDYPCNIEELLNRDLNEWSIQEIRDFCQLTERADKFLEKNQEAVDIFKWYCRDLLDQAEEGNIVCNK